MTFEQWFKRVNSLVARAIGLGASDLPDRCWHDLYDDGLTPEEAIESEYGDLSDEENLCSILCE